MLDVRKLRMLAELERLGTVGAVADELAMTGPAVSMQLAALARELGLPLTERRGRRVALTPAGRLLARHGRDVVDLLVVAEAEAQALREGAIGTYTVAAFPTAARAIVPTAWRLLADSSSDIRLHVVECEPQAGLAALADGQADLAMTHAYSNLPALDAPTLVVRPAGSEPVLLAVPAGGDVEPERRGDRPVDPGAGPVDLAAYAAETWVLPPGGLASREMVERACGLAGFTPRVVAEVADVDAQLALVAAGAGVALVTRLGVQRVPDGVTLRELRTPVTRRLFTVTRRSSSADPGLTTVGWALRAAARQTLTTA